MFFTNRSHWGLDFYHSSGTIEFLNCGHVLHFHPGDIGITDPHASLRVVDEEDRDAIYFCFDPQSDDSEGIMLPPIISMGDKFTALNDMALDAVRAWPVFPTQSKALLWAILWQVAQHHEASNPDKAKLHPAVRRAVEIIEMELCTGIRISDVAHKAHIAPATLSRLFRRYLNTTAISYLRGRRIERAKFLLQNTDMPIKEIAYRVGLCDLHQLNKSFRKEAGESPSAFRNREA